MSVAIRTATRIQDMDDANVSLGVGTDEYALVYDHDTAKFVLRAPVASPDLSGYALLAGRAGGQTLYGGTAANDDITIHGTSDSTRTTSYVLLQPTAGNVGIGTTAPATILHVVGAATITGGIRPAADSTTALQLQTAAGANVLNVDTTNARVGIGTTGPQFLTEFQSATGAQIRIANNHTGGTFQHVDILMGFYANTGALIQDGARIRAVKETDWTTVPNENAALTFQIREAGGVFERVRITSGGNVGIGTTAPATLLHAVSTTATTNAVANTLTLGSNVTGAGVGATGLGAGLLFQGESSTTADTTQARITSAWIVATHASRTSRLALSAYDTAEREGIRIDSDGAAALLGFYAHAAVAQQVLATGVGATADNIITALQALGLVKQS